MAQLRVAVVGGGLGGLCLAQGLHRAGIDVTVYERDAAPDSRRQGYRLHLDARAGLALRDCLPPDLFELFTATCGLPGRGFTVVSENLRQLHAVRTDPAADPYAAPTLSTSADRRTLREVLAAGLDDRISHGSELTGYQADADGVRLSFADGRSATADLLVGADGVHSAVRRQYLPHARVLDTGGRCVYGRTPLGEAARSVLPAPLHDGFMAVVGGPVGMATGLVCFREPPERAAERLAPGVRLTPTADYLMWALAADQRRFGDPRRLGELDPAGLHALALRTVRSWHPDLLRLVELADVAETFLIRIRTSEPVPAWQPTRVTLLGDAIHAMSPARGSGANTALRDAALLARRLVEAVAERRDPVAAVGAYEAEMREYGFAAVAASRQAEAELATRRGGLRSWLFRRLGGTAITG
jgi:2-polyprenyl-6-methoxyphenol hydroxylase-like FAD-dependent oxidoreductase